MQVMGVPISVLLCLAVVVLWVPGTYLISRWAGAREKARQERIRKGAATLADIAWLYRHEPDSYAKCLRMAALHGHDPRDLRREIFGAKWH